MWKLYKRGEIWWASKTVDGRTVRRTTRLEDKKTAEILIRRWDRDDADPANAAGNQATIESAVSAYILSLRAKGRADATIEIAHQKCGHVIRVFGVNSPLSSMTAKTVDDYCAQRLDEGASEHTIHKELVAMRGMLKQARRRGEFKLEPAAVLPVGWATKYEPRKATVAELDIEPLLDALPKSVSAPVAFSIATSARRSEVENAEESHVDFDGGFVFLDGKKTEDSRRYVPITSISRALLERAVRDGNGVRPKLFRSFEWPYKALHRACEKLDIPYVTPNDMRRTCLTRLQARGVPNEHLAKVAGHGSTAMVEKVYGRADHHAIKGLISEKLEQSAVGTKRPLSAAKCARAEQKCALSIVSSTVSTVYQTSACEVDSMDSLDSVDCVFSRNICRPCGGRTRDQRIKSPLGFSDIPEEKTYKKNVSVSVVYQDSKNSTKEAQETHLPPDVVFDLDVASGVRKCVALALDGDEARTLDAMRRVCQLAGWAEVAS
jgi:integrase